MRIAHLSNEKDELQDSIDDQRLKTKELSSKL
jgi:hypothetical protein